MSDRARSLRWLCLILAVALATRLAAAGWWQARLPAGQTFAFGDSDGYWRLGQAITAGAPYEYGGPDGRVFRTPGYPLLLAPIFWTAGPKASVWWGRMHSAVLGTAAVAGVWWLTQKLFAWPTAPVAAALAALYPGAIGMSVFVLTEAPFTCCLLLELGWWIQGARAGSLRCGLAWGFATGLAAAAATLIRPSWLLFTPVAAVVGVVCASAPARTRQLALFGAALAGLALGMSPWWIRNHRVYGQFIPTSLQVGASLYDGLSPQADGSSEMSFVPRFTDAQHAADAEAGLGPTGFEVRLDSRLREAALAWAREHPAAVARLAFIKLGRMWNVWPNQAEFRSWPLRLAVALTYAPVMLLAIAGTWRFRQLGWPLALCWLPAIYLTLLHMVFVGSIRYREPAVMVLFAPAAAWLTAGRATTGPTSINGIGA
jgi:4-amino-4-deoxy-L-arabinose transferase-like glycosyltransferase